MVSHPTWQVPKDVLEDMFSALSLWAKIDDKRLRSELASDKVTPAHHYADALSLIVKHFFLRGGQALHVATTHRIMDRDGNILHEDAKDLLVGGIKFWRA